MNEVISYVKSMLEAGSTLKEALEQVGISYNKWHAICRKEGIRIRVPQGKRPSVYTPERVAEVKRRVRRGEFLRDVAKDMGMDPKNLARYCRRNGIRLFTKQALRQNYKRRDYSKAGRGTNAPSSKVVDIERYIAAGFSDSEIARELGVTRQYANHVRHRPAKGSQEDKD